MAKLATAKIPDLARCDIAIVGGGLVGCSLFLALKNSGLQVALVEAGAQHQHLTNVADARHLALNAQSVATLGALGVSLDLHSASKITQVRINRAGEFGRVDLKAAEHGLTTFGQLIPAFQLGAALEAAMLEVCAKNPSMQRIQPARLTDLQLLTSAAQLTLQTGENSDLIEQILHTQLVIGADGTASAVRQFAGLGAQTKARDYQQSALVFNFSGDLSTEGLALERFSDTGPLAVLPLPNRRLGAVWTLPSERAFALQNAPQQFASAFQNALGSTFGRVRQLGTPVIWPLQLMQCVPNVGYRCALIGNAAQTIHPLGAQGFNLGLRDAVHMAEYLTALGDSAECAKQASNPAFFTEFATARAPDRDSTIAFSDGLLASTSSPSRLSSLLRSIGLTLLAGNSLIQRDVIRFGLGFTRSNNLKLVNLLKL